MTLQVLVFLAAVARHHGLHVPLAASPTHRHTHCAPDVCHRAARTASTQGSCWKNQVHVFDNGVKLCEKTITKSQRARYKAENLHEPVESKIFYSLISRSKSNDTFVDVGGAVGFYALWALRVAPALQVWAFNPSPFFQKAFANHAILNFPGEAAELGRLCQDFRAMTVKDDDHMSIGAKYGSHVTNATANQDTCTTVTYATWAGEKGVQSPFLVMTDIQGAEATVVPSMLAGDAAPNLLMVGTHGGEIHKNLQGALGRHGYSVLFDEWRTKLQLQPDGILVAVRDEWQRAPEFKRLVQHFANATEFTMPFKKYAGVQKRW